LLLQCRDKRATIGGKHIREKALELAAALGIKDFKASARWLRKFQQRHGIAHYICHGEAADADEDGAQSARDNLPGLIEQEVSSRILGSHFQDFAEPTNDWGRGKGQ
jgi:hypothetical protein